MADDVELIGGQEKRPIVLVDYDEAWSTRYDVERARIEVALDDVVHRTAHVGSTSVPGLSAKPIIDIQLAVLDPDDEGPYLGRLERIGYVLRVRQTGHRMLRTLELDVHIHVCPLDSGWERRHLLFRDWLRHSDEDRRLYGQAKADLARRDWPTMNHYADAKSEVIIDITNRAEDWAARTRWDLTTRPPIRRTDIGAGGAG
jgi:GrpB-like predicted nucleotidyltransferase (UPF0157 family)